ncbi:MAG: TlyA family RNA methyltransferase [Hyphomonadaceae bacterium]
MWLGERYLDCCRADCCGIEMSDSAEKRRLDAELVRRGLASSRSQAQAAIAAGKVVVAGKLATRAGQQVSAIVDIQYEPPHPWASRAGLKLAHGLEVFDVPVAGRICLDVGASTGGFTDVLLTRGASRVIAVDVGRSQFLERLKSDPRVVSMEGTDARSLTAEILGETPDVVVCDASFIGLSKVLDVPLSLAADAADLVALFKPQFEVGPDNVGRGGLVTDRVATDEAAQATADWLQGKGWRISAWADSPILGGDGNRERLFHAVRMR